MIAFICPTCLRVCSPGGSNGPLLEEAETAWCIHNGVFREEGPTIFRRDPETMDIIYEWTQMEVFNPEDVLKSLA